MVNNCEKLREQIQAVRAELGTLNGENWKESSLIDLLQASNKQQPNTTTWTQNPSIK